jgi:hypothetical protein
MTRRHGNVVDVSRYSPGGTPSNDTKMAVKLGDPKVGIVLTRRYWK